MTDPTPVPSAADAQHRRLASKLRTMLNKAPIGRMSTIHHLFGILYASEMSNMAAYELDYVVSLAGSKDSMGREINRGRNLASYIDVKPHVRTWR